MSGAMATFFDNPDQWERLRADRSLLPLRPRRCSGTSPLS